MANVKVFVRKTLRKSGDISEVFINFIESYLQDVNRLEYDEEPDYTKIHSNITYALACFGHKRTADNFYIFTNECRKNFSSPIFDSRNETNSIEDLISQKQLVDNELIKAKV